MSFDRTSSFSILLYLFSFIHSISCITSPIETYRISFTAAIYKQIVPSSYAMRKIALDADVYNQMIILNMIPSNTNVDDILQHIPSERLFWTKDNYKTYDCEIGFFYDAHPDQKPLWQVLDQFSTHLQIDSHSLIDPNTATTFSMDNQASNGIFVNTSQITITPATFSIQRCADGSAVSGEQTCPEIDPALIPAAAKTSTSSTTQLLTIIVPIIGGVVVIALIIVAIIIVRRRRVNKGMQPNIQQNEADVEVNMA